MTQTIQTTQGQKILDSGQVLKFDFSGKTLKTMTEAAMIAEFLDIIKKYDGNGDVRDSRDTVQFYALYLAYIPAKNALKLTGKNGEKNRYFQKGGHIVGVEKRQAWMISFQNYENAVNNALEKQEQSADFVADKHAYAESIKIGGNTSAAVGHAIVDGEYRQYFLVRHIRSIVKSVYIDIDTGKDVTEYCQNFEKNNYDSKKQSDAGLTGDKQVKPKSIKPANIYAVSMHGETYLIKH